MSFNDLMHPRNIYRSSPPDFVKLAERYEQFRKHTKQGKFRGLKIDFKDPEALKALNCTLLEHDFGLKMEIPLDRLIPTVPLRLNYVLWLEDLLSCLPTKQGEQSKEVRGIDIGVGASCIYPLLGAKLNGWNFLGTEVEDTSISFARENIKSNNLDEKIKVKKVSPSNYLLKPLEDEIVKLFDFCMCNPPFFASEAEAAFGDARNEKRPLPSSVCTGIPSETVAEGGEVAFVKGIIDDSLILKEQIRWYTTMLGKKTSVTKVLSYLKEKGVTTITTTEFCQGRTRRWGIAWTFIQGVQPESLPSQHRKQSSFKKAKPLRLVIPETYTAQLVREEESADIVAVLAEDIKHELEDLEVDVQPHQTSEPSSSSEVLFYCLASKNTWAHQRRKRRERKREAQKDKDDEIESTPCKIPKNEENVEVIHLQKEQPEEGTQPEMIEKLESNDQPSEDLPLCNFFVLITSEKRLNIESTTDFPVLEMQWLDGQNKNDLYQLFQYLQNKVKRGMS